ncbi:MAG: hypothetical protein P9M02_03825 [Candidatus Susulua stagnicola]|nr:hypothetical protein [Candidatus Susulua stagnicola]
MKATKGTEILFTGENKIGELEEISRIFKDVGVNIRAISAWAVNDKAVFRFVTSDNIKIKELLLKRGSVEEREIIIVELPDETGQLQLLTSKLKGNGLNLDYMYGTTYEPGKYAIIIFSANDNNKALEMLSTKDSCAI